MRQKRNANAYTNLDEYFLFYQGHPLLLDNEICQKKYEITGLQAIKKRLLAAIAQNKKIQIYADYDADGISSGGLLHLLISSIFYGLKAIPEDGVRQAFEGAGIEADISPFLSAATPNFAIHIPRRFSEGYGIKPASLDSIDADLLITVDNGISAIEAIKAAKRKGIEVIVLDHHLPQQDSGNNPIYPNADILVDPEAIPGSADYDGYCGAGLAFKLIEAVMPRNKPLQDKASALAAIGTIADVVPLTKDNRRIVKQGLQALNHNIAPMGIVQMLASCGLSGRVGVEDISFGVAPMINAAGRLYDDGGEKVLYTMLESNPDIALSRAFQLKEVNAKRKAMVNAQMSVIKTDNSDPVNFILCSPLSDDPITGILGLIAGKLAELTGKPSFVFACNNGICSGSARSDDETINPVISMLDRSRDLLSGFGGHAGAAGFSFPVQNMPQVHQALSSYPVIPHDRTLYYDLDLNPAEASAAMQKLSLMEPFGKGMPRPVFRVPVSFGGTSFYRIIGKNQNTVQFLLPGNIKAIGFGMAERFFADGAPNNMFLYGDLCMEYYKGTQSVMFRIQDYDRFA